MRRSEIRCAAITSRWASAREVGFKSCCPVALNRIGPTTALLFCVDLFRALRHVKDFEIPVLNRVRQYLVNHRRTVSNFGKLLSSYLFWSRCKNLGPHKVRASVWLTINRQI